MSEFTTIPGECGRPRGAGGRRGADARGTYPFEGVDGSRGGAGGRVARGRWRSVDRREQRGDRDEARRAKTAALVELRSARDHLDTARDRVSTRQTAVTAATGLFADYANAIGAIVTLVDEEAQLASKVQAEGARSDANADDFNAAIDQLNDVADQYNAAVDAFSQHFQETEPSIT